MRQSLAKGQRRDLRRAMGIGALSAIQEQDQAIAILSNALTNCQREIATLAINHATFKKQMDAELTSYYALFTPALGLLQRSFLDRLRWLLTGK